MSRTKFEADNTWGWIDDCELMEYFLENETGNLSKDAIESSGNAILRDARKNLKLSDAITVDDIREVWYAACKEYDQIIEDAVMAEYYYEEKMNGIKEEIKGYFSVSEPAYACMDGVTYINRLLESHDIDEEEYRSLAQYIENIMYDYIEDQDQDQNQNQDQDMVHPLTDQEQSDLYDEFREMASLGWNYFDMTTRTGDVLHRAGLEESLPSLQVLGIWNAVFEDIREELKETEKHLLSRLSDYLTWYKTVRAENFSESLDFVISPIKDDVCVGNGFCTVKMYINDRVDNDYIAFLPLCKLEEIAETAESDYANIFIDWFCD